MSYAGRTKYDEPGRAARYRERSTARNAEEWALLGRLLDTLDPQPVTALDVPCGTGRIAERLLARGLDVTCADLSPAMRAETEARLEAEAGYLGTVSLDLEAPGAMPPGPADLVVCFRFLHHLPSSAQRVRVLRTLRQLSARDVVVSFHHPVSFHNLSRGVRRLVKGVRGDRHTVSPGRLRREAAEAGLSVVRLRPLARWRREFWLAHLRPIDLPAM